MQRSLAGSGRARTRTRVFTAVVVLLGVVANVGPFAAPAQAAVGTHAAYLSGHTEVDGSGLAAGDPDGSGTAAVTIDTATDTVCAEVRASDIASVTGWHIHNGAFGGEGPILVDFTAFDLDTSTLASTCVIDSDADAVAATPAGFYVNVHSTEFPAGAVRGQLALPPELDLETSVTAVDDEVDTGDVVSFDVLVRNNGPAAATGITITSVFSGSANVPAPQSGFGGFACSPDGTDPDHTMNCSTTDPLAPGATVSGTIGVFSDAVGTVSVTVTSSAPETDVVAGNTSASDSTTVSEPAATGSDVQISKTNTCACSPEVGEAFDFQIDVFNNGPDAATSVGITDTLPVGLVPTLAVPTQGACDPIAGQTVTCDFGSLAASSGATVSITTDPTSAGSYTNEASIVLGAGVDDPNLLNNTDDDVVNVGAGTADLYVAKYGEGYYAAVGREFRWIVEYENYGDVTAQNVVVTDTVPAGATWVSATIPGCTESLGVVTCQIGDVPADGETYAFALTFLAPSDVEVELYNEIQIATSTPETYYNDNDDQDWIYTVPDDGSVDIYKWHDEDVVGTSDPIEWWVEVYNSPWDGGQATNVVVTDELPAGTTFAGYEIEADDDGYYYGPERTCSATGQVVTCQLHDIQAWNWVDVKILATAPIGTYLNQTASVTSDQNSYGPVSDSEGSVQVIADSSDLRFNVDDNPSTVEPDNDVVYDVDVSNDGPSAAQNVVLTQTIPDNATFGGFVDPDAGGGGGAGSEIAGLTVIDGPMGDIDLDTACTLDDDPVDADTDPDSFSCALGTIPREDNISLGFVLHAGATVPGTISTTGTVSSQHPDPDLTNNSETETTDVAQASADLAGHAQYFPASTLLGSSGYVTSYFRNDGPTTARDVVFTATIPAGFAPSSWWVYNGSTGAYSYDCSITASTFTCPNVGDIASDGSTLYVEFYGQWTALGDQTIVASVSSSTPDPDPTDNSQSATTNVTPLTADLGLYFTQTDTEGVQGEATNQYAYFMNNGPHAVQDAVITVDLPTDFTLSSYSAYSYWYGSRTCSQVGQTLTCDIGYMAYGHYAGVEITGNFGAANPSTTVWTISSVAADDPVPENDSFTNTATVLANVIDLGVTKEVIGTATRTDPVEYRVKATSHSGPDASGVQVVDTLPANTRFQYADFRDNSDYWWAGSCTHSGEATGGTVTCTSAYALNSGDSVYAHIWVTPTSAADLVNNATVSHGGTEPNPDPTPNTAQLTTVLGAQRPHELYIDKYEQRDPWAVDENQTFRIDIGNYAEGRAQNVVVTDVLHGGLQFVSATDAGGGNPNCTHSGETTGGTITCAIGDLEAYYRQTPGGGNYYRHILVTVKPLSSAPANATLPLQLTNTASITATGPEGNPSYTSYPNSDATDITVESNQADLYIDKYESSSPIVVGARATFNFGIHNYGPATATGVTVVDTLPVDGSGEPLFTYHSSYNSSCSVSADSITITCLLADRAPNTGDYFEIYADARTTTGDFVNTATISSAKPDPDASNSTDTEPVTIAPDVADLRLNHFQQSDADPVIGEMYYHYVEVNSLGPATATGTTLTIPFPAEITVDHVDGHNTGCAQNATTNVFTCPFGDITRGDSRWVWVYVVADTTGSYPLTATVSGSKPDPDGANNSKSLTTVVDADDVDLHVTKSASRDPGVRAEPQWWDIQVTNSGPGTATNVELTDTLPGGVTFNSVTTDQGTCDEDAGTVTCQLGNVLDNDTSGDTANVRIHVTPTAVTNSLSNTASVTSSKTELNALDNSTTELSAVADNRVDLLASKSTNRNPGVVDHPQHFYLQAHNAGPATATAVTITDVIPDGFTIVGLGDNSGNGIACSIDVRTVTCLDDVVLAGHSAWTYVNVIPTEVAEGVLNRVDVDAAESEIPTPAYPNFDEITFDVVSNEVDIQLDKTVSRNPGVVGEPQYYNVSVHNNSNADASEVVVTDSIPSLFDLAADVFLGSSGDADCSATVGREVSCSFASIPAFGSRTVRVNVVPNAAGTGIVNTAVSPVLANEMAGQHADNTDSVTSRVVTPQVDLQAHKSPSPSVGVVGEPQTWTLQVTNHGPALAEAVTLDDTFPANLRVDSVVGSVCEETSDQVVHCDFGDVALNQSRFATVVVTPQVAGSNDNTITAASATPEVLNPAYPNTVTVTGAPVVNDEVDLAPYITTDMHGRVGRAQSYYMEVGNYWFGTVTNAELEATIPAGMTITGIGAKTTGLNCSTTGQVVTCVKSSLGSGQSLFAYINVVPNAIGLHTATVVSDSVEADVNPSNDSFGVTSKVSAPPIASLEIDPPSGVFPLPVTATLDATDPEGDAMYFELLWGDGGFNSGPLTPGMTLDHTYTVRGPFVATLYVYDIYQHISGAQYLGPLCGVSPEPANCGKDVQVVSVDLPTPLEAVADPALNFTTVNAPRGIRLNGADSSPLAGITAMDWVVSPPVGVTGTGYPQSHSGAVTPELDFTHPGTYTATLTVHSGSETDTDTALIEVGPEPEFDGLKVHVRRLDNNAIIGGADVLVVDAEGTNFSDDSEPDSSRGDYGTAFLHGLADGEHTVYVLAEGYRPNEAQAVVADDFGEVTVYLEEGGIVAAVLTAERLTPQEAIDLGVDPDDPDNQNVYEFEINLAFDTTPIPFSGYVTPSGGFSFGTGFGGGGGGGGGCAGFTCSLNIGGDTVQVGIEYVEDVPTLTYMVIPGKAKWLKEFYKVEMTIQNLGSPSFVLQDGVAQLNLPTNGGLGLPALFGQQQANPAPVPDMAGGESEKVQWIVRGDAEGYYGGPDAAGTDHDLTATYTGVLSPITKAVTITAGLAKPIKVWGLSAVRLEVDADDAAFERNPYDVTVRIRNVTNEDPDPNEHIPLYNLSLELLTSGTSNFIYQPGQQLLAETPSLEPGDFIEIDAKLIPTFTGTLVLSESFVRKSGSGETDDTAIITDQPAIPLGDRPAVSGSTIPGGVHLEWEDSVVGESGWEIYSTVDQETHFANPPVETLPADETEIDFGYPEGAAEFVVTPIVDGKPDMRHAMVHVVSGGTVANTPPVAEDAIGDGGHRNPAGINVEPVVTDVDGNPLTYSLVGVNGGADHGNVTLNEDGISWHYVPTGDFVGTDTFIYSVSDGFANDTGEVTIELTNTPPVAVDDSATTIRTNPVAVSVLVNDTDPDNENPVLLASTGLSPEGAGVVCNAVTNKCTYTPSGSFTGVDTFQYEITDAHGGDAIVGTVYVTVEPAPLVEVGTASVTEGHLDGSGNPVVTVLQVPITVTGTVNTPVKVDFKTGDNTAKSALGDYQPKVGSITFNEAGTQLVPVNVLGDVSTENNEKFWMYLSKATNAERVNTRASQTILDDDGVVVADASGSVGHLNSAGVDITLSATAPSGGTATFALFGSNGGATKGTASITGSTLHYTPTGHPTSSSDTVKYTATIAGNTSAVSTATITLTNAGPIAVDDEFDASSGFGSTFAVMANESPDADGENPVMVAGGGPTAQGGSYSCSTSSGMCTYTSAAGFVGDDTFDYVIDDPHGGLASVGTVVVHVQGLPQFTLTALGAVLEPDTGQTVEQAFRITLTGDVVGTARIGYKTGSNTATSGVDFVSETATVDFTAAGTHDFTITVNGDLAVEPNERYWMYLQNPHNAELSPSYVRQPGIITNDD